MRPHSRPDLGKVYTSHISGRKFGIFRRVGPSGRWAALGFSRYVLFGQSRGQICDLIGNCVRQRQCIMQRGMPEAIPAVRNAPSPTRSSPRTTTGMRSPPPPVFIIWWFSRTSRCCTPFGDSVCHSALPRRHRIDGKHVFIVGSTLGLYSRNSASRGAGLPGRRVVRATEMCIGAAVLFEITQFLRICIGLVSVLSRTCSCIASFLQRIYTGFTGFACHQAVLLL